MAEIGEQLRAAREAQGLTLDDIERATCIRARYLQALEDEDFGALPGRAHVRGFLRTYARELGLDAAPLLARIGPPPPSIPPPRVTGGLIAEPLQPTPLPVMSIAWTLIVLALLGSMSAGVWWAYPRRAELMTKLPGSTSPLPGALATPSETAVVIVAVASPTPAFVFVPTVAPDATATATAVPTATTPPRPTATPTSPPATDTPAPTATPEFDGVEIEVSISEPTWVWVRADGQQVFMGTLQAGARQSWEASETLFMRTGNAGGMRLALNGEDLGVMGRQGEVVNRTWERGPEGGAPVLVEWSGGVPPADASN